MSDLAAPGRRRPIAVGISLFFHLAAAVGILVASSWNIEQLGRPRHTIAPTFWKPNEREAAGGGETARLKGPKKGTKQVATHAASASEIAPDDVGSGAGGEDAGGGGGSGPGTGVGEGLGIDPLGSCLGGDCDGPPPVELPPDPPASVPADILEGHRIAGKTEIHPTNRTAIQIKREGRTNVMATVKVCIDRNGAVNHVSFLHSTGYPDYDARLRQEIKRWRYRPYVMAGKATAACTPVQFRYLVK